jgi:hypothetical protein
MLKKFSALLVLFFLLFICSIYSQPAQKKILKDLLKDNHSLTNVTKYLNKKIWNQLFPHRYGVGMKDTVNHNPDFYSFKAFVTAAKLFPTFLSEGNDTVQKRELCAFLANVAQETSGGWDEAPGGYFKWGLYFLTETGNRNGTYADTSKKNYPPVPGKFYYGRGPKQLSWNYNYGQFSEAWYGDKNTLLKNPDLLSENAILSFASAIWFWMTPQFPKPSCHDIMVNNWKPTANDIQKNRLPGFGATINVINGGVECGKGLEFEKTTYRYKYYSFFCNYFNVSPGDNINCDSQKPFGQ